MIDDILGLSEAATINHGRAEDSPCSLIERTMIFLHFLLTNFGETLQDGADGVGRTSFIDVFDGRVLKISEKIRIALLTFHPLAVDVGSSTNGFQMCADGWF